MKKFLLLSVLLLAGCDAFSPPVLHANEHSYLYPACEPILVLGIAQEGYGTRMTYYVRHNNGTEEYVPSRDVEAHCVTKADEQKAEAQD